MTTLTPNQITEITTARNANDASAIAGNTNPGNAHYVKIAYIQAILGPRATGGFFAQTRANVNAKFAKAWETAQK